MADFKKEAWFYTTGCRVRVTDDGASPFTFFEETHFANKDGEPFKAGGSFDLGEPDISSVTCDEYSLHVRRDGQMWAVEYTPTSGPTIRVTSVSRPQVDVQK